MKRNADVELFTKPSIIYFTLPSDQVDGSRIDVQRDSRSLSKIHGHKTTGEHDGLGYNTGGVHGQFGKEALVGYGLH